MIIFAEIQYYIYADIVGEWVIRSVGQSEKVHKYIYVNKGMFSQF